MARVLVVDDEPMILTMMQRVLERDGHEVFTAGTGREAIAVASAQTFDLALVDYEMPNTNGLKIFQQLCTLQPVCARVLLSGRLAMPMMIESINEGQIHRVLAKPVSLETIRETVAFAESRSAQLAENWRVWEQRKSDQHRDHIQTVLDEDRLQLALQPILSATDQELVAHEALMRSSYAPLPHPLAVLQSAEECNMIPAIGARVARKAAEWMPQLPYGTELFVNLHPVELQDLDQLLNHLGPLRPWSSHVVLEITEHSHVKPGPTWVRAVQALRAEGFAIAVDDLGAGYNSLNILAALQPDYIKVDMSIVRDIDFDPYKQRLMSLLVGLADSTGSILIAEGVETAAETTTPVSLGVHRLQG